MADPSDCNDNKCVSNKLSANVDNSNTENDSNHEAPSACSHSEAERTLESNPSPLNHSKSSSHFSGAASGSNSKRKEANPYSFKHFLTGSTGSSQNTGAHPQHYTNKRSNSEPGKSNPMDPNSNSLSCSRSNRNSILNNPDLASGLPDFVQDHLIMEQCFLEPNLSNTPQASYNLEDSHIYQLENAILNSSINSDEAYQGGESRSANSNDIPFDLTSTMPNQRRDQDILPSLPLDLPSFHSANSRSGRPRDPPLDLPSSSNTASGACSQTNSEVGTSKSLPDFLSDGPIHQRRGDEPTANDVEALLGVPHESAPVERRLAASQLQAENLRLQREVESLSSLLKESNDRLERSERRHRIFADNVDKEVNSTKDDLRRTMERATTAEATVFQLKQEVKVLQAQLHNLRQGEQSSTDCDIKGDGDRTAASSSPQDLNQRLAIEINNTASTAETSLRQLLSHVDTLRMIASSLENSTKESEIKTCSSKDSGNKDLRKS